jgi:hypothetical protein
MATHSTIVSSPIGVQGLPKKVAPHSRAMQASTNGLSQVCHTMRECIELRPIGQCTARSIDGDRPTIASTGSPNIRRIGSFTQCTTASVEIM